MFNIKHSYEIRMTSTKLITKPGPAAGPPYDNDHPGCSEWYSNYLGEQGSRCLSGQVDHRWATSILPRWRMTSLSLELPLFQPRSMDYQSKIARRHRIKYTQ